MFSNSYHHAPVMSTTITHDRLTFGSQDTTLSRIGSFGPHRLRVPAAPFVIYCSKNTVIAHRRGTTSASPGSAVTATEEHWQATSRMRRSSDICALVLCRGTEIHPPPDHGVVLDMHVFVRNALSVRVHVGYLEAQAPLLTSGIRGQPPM